MIPLGRLTARHMILMVVVAMDAPSASDRGCLFPFVGVTGLTSINGRYENVVITDTMPCGHGIVALSAAGVVADDTISLSMPVVGEFRVGQPFVRDVGRSDTPV